MFQEARLPIAGFWDAGCGTSGIGVSAPDYSLAPEPPAPAAVDDALAAIDAMEMPAGQLILSGDSAGGGRAAAACADLCGQARRPRGMVLLSPWTELSLSGASLVANAPRDPVLPADQMAEAARQIRGRYEPTDPRISPLFANWTRACPTYIPTGSTEVLLDDTLRLADVLRGGAGGEVPLERLSGAPHVIAFLAPLGPETSAAIDRIGGFSRSLSSQPTSDS